MTKRRLPKKIIALIVCGSIIFAIGVVALGFYFHFLSAHRLKVIKPGYAREEIAAVLDKDELSEDDYALLYRQTGLTKIGIDRAREHGEYGKSRVLKIQKDVFDEHEVVHDLFAPYVCQDDIKDSVTNIYLEPGDIIVTSSTHIAGFRIGHAGLVCDSLNGGANGRILQASQIGSTSDFGDFSDFSSRINFMILRPNPELIDAQTVADVCEFAKTELTGLSYFPAAGVLSKKSNVKKTQCAHIVWYAYNKFGYDLDSNGGAVVTPKNLADSEYLEVVQVFGFDFGKLWK